MLNIPHTGDPLPALLFALLIDALIGDPAWLYRRLPHPAALLGHLVGWLDRTLNHADDPPATRRGRGIVAVVLLVGLAGFVGWAIAALLHDTPLRSLWLALVMSTLLARRSLEQHVAAVADGLERSGLAAGREAVAHIVGRDPESLDEAGVSRAALESLAENFSDGVVAPTFWAVLFGLPGLLVYKAINTADSMIGHRTERHEAFGWAAARLDDIVNFVPARLAGLLLVVVALVHPEADAGAAWRAMWRDAKRHRSPNAGWQEAPLAGALGLALAGPRRYHGTVVDDAWMGEGGRADAGAADIRRGLVLYRLAAALVIVLVGAALFAYKKL
jgi:adenosylcobinamide-phosphate synthase